MTESTSTGIEATTTGSEATATVADFTSTVSKFTLTGAGSITFKTVANALVSVTRIKGFEITLKWSKTLQLLAICAKPCG